MKKIHILVLLIIFMFSCSKEEKKVLDKEPKIIKNVLIDTVKYSKLKDEIKLTGSIIPKDGAKILSKVMGEVKKIYLKEGEYVKKDQIILTIDDRLYKARLKQALSAENEVKKNIKASKQKLNSAKAQFQLAKKTYNRFVKLKQSGVISKQKYDEVKSNYISAKSNYLALKEKLDALKQKLKQIQAKVDEAHTYLSYTKIRAPFNGIIMKKFVDIGDSVTPGSPIVEVQQQKKYQIKCSVPENYINLVKIGQTLNAQVLNNDIAAKVSTIVPFGNELSRSYEVKLDVDSYDFFKPGMYATVYIPTKEKELILLPQKAIVSFGQITGIYVVDHEGIVNFRVVRVGRKIDDKVEIISGVKQGEKYIMSPTYLIKDGDKVDFGS